MQSLSDSPTVKLYVSVLIVMDIKPGFLSPAVTIFRCSGHLHKSTIVHPHISTVLLSSRHGNSLTHAVTMGYNHNVIWPVFISKLVILNSEPVCGMWYSMQTEI